MPISSSMYSKEDFKDLLDTMEPVASVFHQAQRSYQYLSHLYHMYEDALYHRYIDNAPFSVAYAFGVPYEDIPLHITFDDLILSEKIILKWRLKVGK